MKWATVSCRSLNVDDDGVFKIKDMENKFLHKTFL